MLSKSQISLLTSLQHKKFRHQHGLFVVEGFKSIVEFINSPYRIHSLYYAPAAAPKLLKLSQKINSREISLADLQKASLLKTPADAIAAVYLPDTALPADDELKGNFTLVLDGVQDPGNMGTIIRTADWFGIKNIICSEDTVDAYNPKVVQATMGSLARVAVNYTDIEAFLGKTTIPAYGALLNGTSIYETGFGNQGLIVMGNEGNGVRPEIEILIANKVTIPRIGGAESLNVAIATAIFCAEAARKSFK